MDDSDSDSSVERLLSRDRSFIKSSLFERDCTSNSLSSSSEVAIDATGEEHVEIANVKETPIKDIPLPTSRYDNLTLEELNNLAERIKVYHQVGIVVPSEDIVPCQRRPKRVRNKRAQRLQQNTRKRKNTCGNGRIGTASSTFGAKRCLCCNLGSERLESSHRANTCSAFGVEQCTCCNREPFVTVDDDDVFLIDDNPINQFLYSRNEAEERSESVVELNTNMPRAHTSYGSEPPASPYKNHTPILATSTPLVSSGRKLNESIPSNDSINLSNVRNSTERLAANSEERAESVDVQEEEHIMDFVNNLLGPAADTISEEVEERFQRLCESRRVASEAISNAVSCNHDALHEEMDLDNSVVLVSVDPPQPIVVEDSAIQIDDVDNGCDIEVIEDSVTFAGETRKRTRGSNLRPRRKRKCPNTVEQKSVERPPGAGRLLHECPICLESLANSEVSATICGHIFCTECIKTAIRTTKMCPNCRMRLTLKKIHPLYI